jgi:hypothetical protein
MTADFILSHLQNDLFAQTLRYARNFIPAGQKLFLSPPCSPEYQPYACGKISRMP